MGVGVTAAEVADTSPAVAAGPWATVPSAATPRGGAVPSVAEADPLAGEPRTSPAVARVSRLTSAPRHTYRRRPARVTQAASQPVLTGATRHARALAATPAWLLTA